ncbi:MAG: UDP-glucose--hexose-1-phosphate uridylyltransferase [Anaerorhabdus sp.]
MVLHEINRLLKFALDHKLIGKRDYFYCANLLLDVFQLSQFEEEKIEEELNRADDILEAMLAYAVEHTLIEDSITERDLFDTRIMNCIMPSPTQVSDTFWNLYKTSKKDATDYYYDLSNISNYVRTSRVEKDQKWKAKSKYGELDITINLSKPEKDPREIAKIRNTSVSTYPKCPICKENEGFAGDYKHNARQTLRLIPLRLHEEDWFLQYSPYVYYNEHCIILNAAHIPMKIDEKTFSNLLEFLDLFPHYFIGSNADLPIVGGSILSHDHYQGGCYQMPMERASVINEYSLDKFPNVRLAHLNWPLSTIRLHGEKASDVISLATHILTQWKAYSDETSNIMACTCTQMHNTITPIARKKNGLYELDLVLRNNRTSEEHPFGIFHPHEDVHHIKKENIGLIEVAGIAVLPARLKDELQVIQKCLCGAEINETEAKSIEKHDDWITYLKSKYKDEKDYQQILEYEIAQKFEKVLEDCGVFKLDKEGIKAFERFMTTL